MSQPYVGEIRMVGFTFAPAGWTFCALPNLQGCAPMHFGEGAGLSFRDFGETGVETAVTLLTTQIPSHTHTAQNAAASNAGTPGPRVLFGGGGRGKEPAYARASASNLVKLSSQAMGLAGNNQPHSQYA